MADAKITALTANTAPIATDIMPMVDDPAGTPLNQKITIANLLRGSYVQGTSMPVGAATGHRFFRTDLGIEFYSDGTRWVSHELFTFDFSTGASAISATTAPFTRRHRPFGGVYSIYLVDWTLGFNVSGGTALSGSHKWVIDLNSHLGALASYSIDSGSSSAWRTSGAQAIGAVNGTTTFEIEPNATKTGTPGDLYLTGTVTYRLITT